MEQPQAAALTANTVVQKALVKTRAFFYSVVVRVFEPEWICLPRDEYREAIDLHRLQAKGN
jgi:hypothetical protein